MTAGPGDVDHRYPLEVGNRWVYQQTRDGVSALVLDAVTETRQEQGEPAVLVQRRDVATGEVTDEALRTSTADGVFELAGQAGGLAGDSRVQLLRFPSTAGSTFTAQDKADLDSGADLDGDGRTERMSQRIDVTVDGPESVSVPAGDFADAVRVRTVVRRVITLSASQRQQTGMITYTDWYAAGVGAVKTTEISDLPGNAYSSAAQLMAYRVGARIGSAGNPSVATMDPVNNTLILIKDVWANDVVVTFDGVLDPASGTDGLTVRDFGGQSVPGQTVGSYTGLRFRPSAPMPPGRYTVTVNGTVRAITGEFVASQPAGTFSLMAMPTISWAPALVSSQPANGSTLSVLDTPIVMNFSTDLDPASVTPDAFAVTTGTGTSLTEIPITAVTLVSPTQVRLSFAQDYRQRYTVSVRSALKGADGTAVAAAQVSFSMASVDFGDATFYTAATIHPPSQLEMDGNPYRAMMADLDGSGRLSLVLAMNPPFAGSVGHHLSIYPPQNGRPLGRPITVPVSGDTTCALWDLATANLRNDGRTAILVGRGRCGITLFERDGSGAWIQTDTVSMGSLAGSRFSVGDLNGDGLPDLAVLGVAGTGSYALSVRYQQPGGGFGSLVTVSGQRDVVRMAIGDVNGDGRADLVLLGSTNNGTGTSVSVLLQGADGTLGTEVVLPVVPAMGTVKPVALALGDINGDGRRDIVVLGGDAAGASLITYTQGADGQMPTPSVMTASTPNPAGLVLADMAGGGRVDIVVGYARQAVIDVFHQMPTGGLRQETVPITLPYAGGLLDSVSDPFCLGDLDGDGRPDLLISSMAQAMMSIRYQPALPASTTAVSAGVPSRSATALSRIRGRTFGLPLR